MTQASLPRLRPLKATSPSAPKRALPMLPWLVACYGAVLLYEATRSLLPGEMIIRLPWKLAEFLPFAFLASIRNNRKNALVLALGLLTARIASTFFLGRVIGEIVLRRVGSPLVPTIEILLCLLMAGEIWSSLGQPPIGKSVAAGRHGFVVAMLLLATLDFAPAMVEVLWRLALPLSNAILLRR